MVRPTALRICFSMVRPTRLDVFQWCAQRAWTFFNGSPNAPGSPFFNGPPMRLDVFQWFAQRAGDSFFNGSHNGPGVSFFNGSSNAPGGVSFFNGSPNVSDFDMWRHANPLNSHTARAPCYMCYMCYMGLTRQPDEPHMCYMCYMGLTRQPAEPPLSPSSLLYVLYVLYGSHKATR